ncbi:MAG TPA: YraN family protein [Lachnospiraceae bacterium]|nr:YraN family protein [Lachnospiraceae bacterium]
MNKRAVGSDYEEKACEFLQTQGFSVLERNFRCRRGEIDIIAREGKYLVFVEVKYRTTRSQGEPEAAVDFRKQRRISRVALYYLTVRGYPETTSCRFDVVGVDPDGFSLIRNAFDYIP